jgi:hypothetical protein
MKTIIFSIITSLALISNVYAEGEVKKKCIDKVTSDGKPVKGKDGKTVQECKEIKVHKKLEGTKVPEKK